MEIGGGAQGDRANSGQVSLWWAGLTLNGGVARRVRAWLGDRGRGHEIRGMTRRLWAWPEDYGRGVGHQSQWGRGVGGGRGEVRMGAWLGGCGRGFEFGGGVEGGAVGGYGEMGGVRGFVRGVGLGSWEGIWGDGGAMAHPMRAL